ncbi:helix-turn-helix transcriptional regulator [Clostridium beijerinckii]|uniref:helix-turn-helix transcriptional regulator n=1 Tax=Clostridium beijerinckii TaxID=1520 RepID=UPI00232A8C72|nr:helix-turn-helix transcriptional regulator [Clostridium beijerinckii]
MLRKKRSFKRLTELELAKRIGVTEGYISKLENHPEKCNPTVNLILKLSRELNINPLKIFLFFIKDKKDQDN